MSRRNGWLHHARRGGSNNDDGSGPTASVAVVDQAECTGRSCRSCVALALADCIALGCCPCAVVSLLGLAFVKAPLAVGRRCVRRRQGRLRHKKRVRDLDMADAAKRAAGGGDGEPGAAMSKGEDDVVTAASPGREVAAASDAEKVWLEMYQVGHWGFGRLSFSVNPPARAGYVATGRNADGDSCGNGV